MVFYAQSTSAVISGRWEKKKKKKKKINNNKLVTEEIENNDAISNDV